MVAVSILMVTHTGSQRRKKLTRKRRKSLKRRYSVHYIPLRLTNGCSKSNNGAKKRKGKKSKEGMSKEEQQEPEEIKTGGFLNLVADSLHNLTDGLAIASSFQVWPSCFKLQRIYNVSLGERCDRIDDYCGCAHSRDTTRGGRLRYSGTERIRKEEGHVSAICNRHWGSLGVLHRVGC